MLKVGSEGNKTAWAHFQTIFQNLLYIYTVLKFLCYCGQCIFFNISRGKTNKYPDEITDSFWLTISFASQ